MDLLHLKKMIRNSTRFFFVAIRRNSSPELAFGTEEGTRNSILKGGVARFSEIFG